MERGAVSGTRPWPLSPFCVPFYERLGECRRGECARGRAAVRSRGAKGLARMRDQAARVTGRVRRTRTEGVELKR